MERAKNDKEMKQMNMMKVALALILALAGPIAAAELTAAVTTDESTAPARVQVQERESASTDLRIAARRVTDAARARRQHPNDTTVVRNYLDVVSIAGELVTSRLYVARLALRRSLASSQNRIERTRVKLAKIEAELRGLAAKLEVSRAEVERLLASEDEAEVRNGRALAAQCVPEQARFDRGTRRLNRIRRQFTELSRHEAKVLTPLIASLDAMRASVSQLVGQALEDLDDVANMPGDSLDGSPSDVSDVRELAQALEAAGELIGDANLPAPADPDQEAADQDGPPAPIATPASSHPNPAAPVTGTAKTTADHVAR